jgi:hypothetical protein
MPDSRATWILLAAAGAFAVLGATTRPQEEQPSQPEASTRPAPEEARQPPTADDILRELRNRQPGREVIPPASLEGRKAPIEKPKLLPEGTAVVDVAGHVERESEGEWWVFVFDKVAVKERYGYEAPTDRIKLLPNSTLEGLVRMARASASPLNFEISGEAAVYRGENYLLVRGAVRGEAARAAKALDASPAMAAKPPVPSETPSVGGVTANASAEEVLEQMKQLSPAGGPLPLSAKERDAVDDEFSSVSADIFEGTPVIRRTGRIVSQGEWWAFAFDSDHGGEAEQPLRLLPNQSLQFMVDLHEREPAGLVFTVSGEVTEFGGRNYLLIRAVTRRLDLGNLRR